MTYVLPDYCVYSICSWIIQFLCVMINFNVLTYGMIKFLRNEKGEIYFMKETKRNSFTDQSDSFWRQRGSAVGLGNIWRFRILRKEKTAADCFCNVFDSGNYFWFYTINDGNCDWP